MKKNSTKPAKISPELEKKIEELIGKMTLNEKVNQMLQLSCQALPEEDFNKKVVAGLQGSYLHVLGPETGRYNDGAAASRLGIMPMFGIDAVHGHALLHGATVFPSQLAMACSFDEELVEKIGLATAKEVAADGLDWVFSPVLCIGRDLRWGRVDETFGEDTLVVSRLGAAIIRGYQTDGLVAACAKHYLAYGEATGGRDAYDTEITERKARESFLPPFRAAVDAGCMTFMTAYGSIDGIPLTVNRRYLREILKDEFGFDGFVVTDWENFRALVKRQYIAKDEAEAAKLGVLAGNDMSMNTPEFERGCTEAVERGDIPMEFIDDAVRRILRVKARLGLLDGTRKRPDRSVIGCAEHEKLNYRAALESCVLLENNGILPLDRKKLGKVAVIGPNADDWRAQIGDWTFLSHPSPNPDAEPNGVNVTVLSGLRAALPDTEIVYEQGCVIEKEISDEESDRMMHAAIAAAKDADVVVLVLGDDLAENGETKDRSDLALYGRQNELARRVFAVCPNVITVMVTGKPLVLGEVKKCSAALLQCFNGGDLGGKAVAALLLGDENFSGKLPISFPYSTGTLPCYYNQYDYWHDGRYMDAPSTNLYYFGRGLSYSEFEYGDVRLSADKISEDGEFTVSVDVKNVSARDGVEVVQLYFRDLICSRLTPVRTLIDFARVEIPAGETKTVTFRVPASTLGFVSEDFGKVVEPGDFRLFVSGDGEHFKTATVTVTE